MIRNVHERVLSVSPDQVAPLIDRVAEPGNPLWPADHWPPLELDRPLGVGADGGHGPIRYTCTSYQPGRRAEFTFAPGLLIRGTHTLDVLPFQGGTLLRHELTGRFTPWGRLIWSVGIRWLHDALIEDLLDRAATAVGHPPTRPARWSPWVRLLRRVMGRTQQTAVTTS